MIELITSRITATALWIPKGWGKYGFKQEQIESAVVHAIHDEKSEIGLKENGEGTKHFFVIRNQPLEHTSESHQGVLEINEFTVDAMTRRYVTIEPSMI